MKSGDSDLLQQAAALPKEIEPERDLWPFIEARLNESNPADDPAEKSIIRPPAWQTSLALAAGLVLAVSVGFWLGSGSRTLPDGQIPAQGAVVHASRPATLPVGQTMAADLYRTRVALSAEIEAALGTLPEEARVVVRENLASINQALEEIDRVLGQAPDHAQDQQLLMTMYADQLALLGSMQRLIRTANSDMKQEILL